MRDAVQPAIGYVNGKKNAARLEHTKRFGKRGVLRRRRFEMMKHQHGDYRGKSFWTKRQRGSVAPKRLAVRADRALLKTVSLDKFDEEIRTVFEAGHARRTLP